MNTDYQRRELLIDVDTTDVEEIEYAVSDVRECASSAVADVSVEVLAIADGEITVEISGFYEDVAAFMRRWEADL